MWRGDYVSKHLILKAHPTSEIPNALFISALDTCLLFIYLIHLINQQLPCLDTKRIIDYGAVGNILLFVV